jgi:putative DNA methylase
MKASRNPAPALTPSFPLPSKETGRVVTGVVSLEPHLGWHSRGYLPHWDHPGMVQSLSFRLADALPQAALVRWRDELDLFRPAWSAGILPARVSRGVGASPTASVAGRQDAGDPRQRVGAAGEQQRQTELRRRVEEYLDAGHGECWLRRPAVATLVEDALRHFDGERYRLLAWWKSFTSKKANRLLGRTGEFWQREYLDRYVRDAGHYAAVIAYIEENPVKAGLAKLKTDWPWSSARFRALGSAGVPPAG